MYYFHSWGRQSTVCSAFIVLAALFQVTFCKHEATTCVACTWKDYHEQLIEAEKLFSPGARNKTLACMFEQMDSNADSAISQEEFHAFARDQLGQHERDIAFWKVFLERCNCDCDMSAITLNESIYKYQTCLSSDRDIVQAWERFCKKGVVSETTDHEADDS